MGCGQSKIHLYPRKSKSKANNGKKSGHDIDADADDEEGRHCGDSEKEAANNNGNHHQHHKGNHSQQHRNEDDDDDHHHHGHINSFNHQNSTESGGKGSPDEPSINGEITIPMLRPKNVSLLQSQEISSSQQNFFRMLDQKIEDGPDYDSSSETEMALEEARLNALVQHWESASLTASMCSSASRSLQTTPIRQSSSQPMRMQPLNAELLTQPQQFKMQAPAGMSPKRGDARALMSQVHQGYGVSVLQSQQLQQQQMQQQMLPQSYSPQSSLLRNAPRMGVPGGGGGVVVPVVSSDGVYNPSPAAMYYQHPSLMHQKMVQMQQTPPIPQPATQVSYYTNMMQHPLQVPSSQASQMLNLNHLMNADPQAQQQQLQQQQQMAGGGICEPKFPPAISVQKLTPQVQRQIRETQELIKDSCPQLYAAGYGPAAGPSIRQPRRHTLETQYSQELS